MVLIISINVRTQLR